MSCKIILSSEPGSAKFTDRVLIIGQEEVRVARSSAEEKADTYNAVFDCRVRDKALHLHLYSPAGFVKISGSLYIDRWHLVPCRHGE